MRNAARVKIGSTLMLAAAALMPAGCGRGETRVAKISRVHVNSEHPVIPR